MDHTHQFHRHSKSLANNNNNSNRLSELVKIRIMRPCHQCQLICNNNSYMQVGNILEKFKRNNTHNINEIRHYTYEVPHKYNDFSNYINEVTHNFIKN